MCWSARGHICISLLQHVQKDFNRLILYRVQYKDADTDLNEFICHDVTNSAYIKKKFSPLSHIISATFSGLMFS